MSDNQPVINWYPGHMAKAKRLLQDQVKRIDLIIEICDARLPASSRNPELDQMIRQKKRLLFLNKADLADQELNQSWLRYYRSRDIPSYLTDAVRLRGKETVGIIERTTKEIVQRSLEKGVRKTVRAMVVGIPNVGKSTIINHLCGRSVTIIGDRPGVTKSNQWVKISPYLEVLDTPGILWPKLEDQDAARKLCYIGCIKDEVVDLTDLTIHLLEELCIFSPDRVMERYHIQNSELKGLDLLNAVCEGRGWLLKGAQYDYDRCCSVVPDEFRSGKLGRITLENPPEIMKVENENKDDKP